VQNGRLLYSPFFADAGEIKHVKTYFIKTFFALLQ